MIFLDADFKTAPYDHQLKEFEEFAETGNRALFWQMRTGKTKVIIDTACHLAKQGKIDTVLVTAPNGVHQNWMFELGVHHWDSVPYNAWCWQTDLKNDGTQRRRLDTALRSRKVFAWFCIASSTMVRDDVRLVIKRIFRNRKSVFAVFDESHDFRTPGSKRSKMARAIAAKSSYRRILTGTPVENSPLNAWGQFELLEKEFFGFKTWTAFKERYAWYTIGRTAAGYNYPKLGGYKHLEELKKKMDSVSSYILRKDCFDLPDLRYILRDIPMNPEQARLYRILRTELKAEIRNGEKTLKEVPRSMIKMQQIASGFLRNKEGRDVPMPGTNIRLKTMLEEAERTPGKVIIWCNFHWDMDACVKVLKKAGHKIVEYHGRISGRDKTVAAEAFRAGAGNSIKALVGYPTLGLDLSAAERIIWYSHTMDAILREQADERATAMGGGNVQVVDIINSPIDRFILEKLRNKVSIADALVRDGLLELLDNFDDFDDFTD